MPASIKRAQSPLRRSRRAAALVLAAYAVFTGVPAVFTNSLELGVTATVAAFLALIVWPTKGPRV